MVPPNADATHALEPTVVMALDWLLDHERQLWSLVVAALTLDLVLTAVGLHAGLSELNPVVAELIGRFGISSLVALKAGAVGIGLCCRPLVPDRHSASIPLALAVPWCVAVVVNSLAIALAA